MQNLYKQIIRIVYVALLGMKSKPEAPFIPRKSTLNNSSYENIRIIYKAQPINRKIDIQ